MIQARRDEFQNTSRRILAILDYTVQPYSVGDFIFFLMSTMVVARTTNIEFIDLAIHSDPNVPHSDPALAGFVTIENHHKRLMGLIPLTRGEKGVLGSDEGGDRAATLYSLLGTARLNGVNPLAYLTHVLKVINDHKVNAIEALLPWRLKETEPSIRVVEATLAQPPDRIH